MGGGRGWLLRRTGALCFIGFILSMYSIYVKMANAADPSYIAMCDISASISCSIVFTSEYGTGFGLVSNLLGANSWLNQPNGVFGLIGYPVIFLTSVVSNRMMALLGLVLGISGVGISIYLGYVLFFVLEDACVVCIATYIVNLLLFLYSIVNYRSLSSVSPLRGARTTTSKKRG